MMKKKNLLLAGAFVLVFLAGAGSALVWNMLSRPAEVPAENALAAETESLLVVNMEDAAEPEGVEDAAQPQYKNESKMKSQLSKINIPDLERVITRSGAELEAPEEGDAVSAVFLGEVPHGAMPISRQPQQEVAPSAESKISMIEAPVQVRVIKNLQEYKDFKRIARGKYPTADFSKDYVVVLESTSNLPDKVFEIQDVQEKDGKMLVLYRVNIFGLDQKTNTHSAVRIDKTDLPVALQQVL